MKKVVLFVAMLVLLLTSAPVFGDSNDGDENLNASLRLRAKLGFNTNISDVRNINSKSEYRDTRNIYGLSLSDEEVAEMNIRESLLGEASNLRKLIYPEEIGNIITSNKEINQDWRKSFAGLYLDNKDNGKIKIGIVDLEQNSYIADQMLKSFSLSDRVSFYNASINHDELLSIQNELTPLFKDLPITDSSVSLQKNKVIIGVQDLAYTDEIESRLSDFAKNHVEYIYNPNVPEPFNTRTNYSTYLRGGLGIDRPTSPTSNVICSSAFNARKQQSNGTYLYYTITAAHCGALASTWTQGGSSMGTAAYRNYGGQSDILAIQIAANRASAQIQNTDTDNVNIVSYVLNQDHTVGTYVCAVGRKNECPTCGTIIDSDYQTSYDSGQTPFTNVVQVDNNQTTGGDSGGSVYARVPNEPPEKRQIHGVLSGGVTNVWYFYSKANRVFTDLGMTQILTANVSFP